MRYYFDYAAATPVAPEVETAMRPYWGKAFGNPGALHWFGQEASAAVFKARDAIAGLLGCTYREIVFTGSATEANNLALRGAIKAFSVQRSAVSEKENKNTLNANRYTLNPKIIVSAIEHDSVLDTAHELEKEGIEVQILPVDTRGIVDLKKLEAMLDERTVLVSIMYVNNEIGTIQPITKIAEIIREFRQKLEMRNERLGKSKSSSSTSHISYPFLHTDAVQAFNYLNCNVDDLGVDLMTLSSQKIYGPKGVGLLYVRQKLEMKNEKLGGNKPSSLIFPLSYLAPLITGGGQEYGLRSGTENVSGIVGFAKAAEIANQLRRKESDRLRKLRDYCIAQMKKKIQKIQFNGDLSHRIPNNINMYIPDKEGQDLVVKLDLAGFAVSPGAACSARTCSPSHVLKALGYSDEQATNSLRITLGRDTRKREVELLLKTLTQIIL